MRLLPKRYPGSGLLTSIVERRRCHLTTMSLCALEICLSNRSPETFQSTYITHVRKKTVTDGPYFPRQAKGSLTQSSHKGANRPHRGGRHVNHDAFILAIKKWEELRLGADECLLVWLYLPDRNRVIHEADRVCKIFHKLVLWIYINEQSLSFLHVHGYVNWFGVCKKMCQIWRCFFNWKSSTLGRTKLCNACCTGPGRSAHGEGRHQPPPHRKPQHRGYWASAPTESDWWAALATVRGYFCPEAAMEVTNGAGASTRWGLIGPQVLVEVVCASRARHV
jgi:hypothetical protein